MFGHVADYLILVTFLNVVLKSVAFSLLQLIVTNRTLPSVSLFNFLWVFISQELGILGC